MFRSRFIRNVFIDGIHINNSTIKEGLSIVDLDSIQNLEINDISMNNTIYDSTIKVWIQVVGAQTALSISRINVANIALYDSPALAINNQFSSISISELYFDNVTVASDISVIQFSYLSALDMNNVTFSNIVSQSTESSNNYIIRILQTGKSSHSKTFDLKDI